MSQSPWSLGLAAGVGCLIAKLLKEMGRFKDLSLDDLGTCLQTPDEELIRELLNPDSQDALFVRKRVGNYRRTQRARLSELQEHYMRMYHNGIRIKWWAMKEQYEIRKHNLKCRDTVQRDLETLVNKATQFSNACRFALLRILFWNLLRFERIVIAPVPSLFRLRTSRCLDIPQEYLALKKCAVDFIRLGYGVDAAKAFAAELRVAL
jgi:hypothetical protein